MIDEAVLHLLSDEKIPREKIRFELYMDRFSC